MIHFIKSSPDLLFSNPPNFPRHLIFRSFLKPGWGPVKLLPPPPVPFSWQLLILFQRSISQQCILNSSLSLFFSLFNWWFYFSFLYLLQLLLNLFYVLWVNIQPFSCSLFFIHLERLKIGVRGSKYRIKYYSIYNGLCKGVNQGTEIIKRKSEKNMNFAPVLKLKMFFA